MYANTPSEIEIHDSSIKNCHATGQYGGAIDASESTLGDRFSLQMKQSEVANCSVVGYGGFLFATFSYSTAVITIDDCTFSGCRAHHGGAFWLQLVQLTIRESHFLRCRADDLAQQLSQLSLSQREPGGRGGVLWANTALLRSDSI